MQVEVSAKRVSQDSEFFAVCYDWQVLGDSKLYATREQALEEALNIVERNQNSVNNCFVYRP